ncbi:l-serine dehydratase [Moniliophthora roreri]|nr:l-serine dehydratase [Moniliophthora roreri]
MDIRTSMQTQIGKVNPVDLLTMSTADDTRQVAQEIGMKKRSMVEDVDNPLSRNLNAELGGEHAYELDSERDMVCRWDVLRHPEKLSDRLGREPTQACVFMKFRSIL